MSIYRCRWQIELLFKELKSDTNWTRFATEQKAIVEGLIWASMLTLIIRRSIALKSGPKVSVFKSAKNVDVWFLPIIKAIAHRAWKEIEHEITWALEYLSKNALRTKQRKPKQDSSLDGIFSAHNS